MIYQKLHVIDGLSKMFVPSTILWRTLNFDFDVPTAEEVVFTKTKTGTWIGRLQMEEQCWEPTVIGNLSSTGIRFRGIIIFLNDLPPPDWTHLIVNGVSFGMDSPGTGVPGSAIFADTAEPYNMDSYINFRDKLSKIYCQSPNFETAIKACKDVWPDGCRIGDRRLLCEKITNDKEYIYNYYHAVIPEN